MRILLLADVHANRAALLAAAAEPHDLCLFLGDLVDYGLEPGPCIDWMRKHARFAVRGNHDHAAVQNVPAVGTNGFKYLTAVTRPLTIKKLTAEERRYLAGLPTVCAVTVDDMRIVLVHGTPRDPLEEYAFNDAEFWGRRLQHLEADVVCVGHTHQPYVLEVGDKRVINPGSVGLPRDGDPRASYAVLDGRTVEHKRVAYAYEETVAVIQTSALPDQAKTMLAELYRTGDYKGPKTSFKNQKSDTKVDAPK